MHAYYYDDNDGSDPKEPHEKNPLTIVTPEELAHVGVSYLHIEGEDFLDKIEKISEERRYKNLSKEALDEEIRYVLDGSGYFDVRDLQDKWIRIAVTKGDLIILPAGIYHRFTTDTNDYIKAMRLFKEEPKWTPINPDDNNFRKDYLKSIQNFGSYK
ncbi:10231_t:CDS:2 [Entrophospora sp. SA101]|nr:10231_t:CDS:2 [Entrophospora sp. SA101]